MTAQGALLGAVRFYQRAVSPTRPPRCRFMPTCSQYAVEALETHGALRGTWLAVVRVLKCAPWHPGGYDPVPERRASRRTGTAHHTRSSNTAAPTSPDSGRSSGSRHPAGLRPGSPAGDLSC